MEQKTVKVSRKKLIWLLVIILILAWVFGGFSSFKSGYSSSIGSFSPSAPMFDNQIMEESATKMMPPDYYPNGSPDITDTRQFLKTSYSADIKTRKVKELVRDIKGIILTAGGRIDNIQESNKYSYFSFVVPKSQFETFRDEVESLTYEKLITVNVSSENLLGQKQNIEEQSQNATTNLANLETQKVNLTSKHNQTLTSLNNRLIALQNQGTTTASQQTILRQNIESENRSYNSQLTNLNQRIDGAKTWITSIEKQDTQFGNNIETVTGSISIAWVSCWQMAKILSPIPPSIILVILLIIIWRLLARFGWVPKIELV